VRKNRTFFCIYAIFFVPLREIISTMNRKMIIGLWTVVLLLLFGCSEKNVPVATRQRGDVLKQEKVRELSIPEIRALVTDSVSDEYLRYPVNCYRLSYSSVYEGDSITTTALMLLPDGAPDTSLCIYMHGTILPIDELTAKQQMPSNFFNSTRPSGGEVATCGLPLASSGFCVVMPDYIGYGTTKEKEHPFVYYPELHFANIDALRALRNVLGLQNSKSLPVWLGGYSQGGGAALSLHYYIQKDYSTEFSVVSSSCLSGPYNYVGQIEGVLRENIPVPSVLISWSAYVLNRFCVHRNPDQIFSFAVTDQVSAITNFNGKIKDIFRPYFIENVLNGKDVEWIEASKRNSFHEGWTPQGRVFLHHGDKDNVVPYFNTLDAYNGLTAAGGNVTVFTYEGKEHTNVTPSYIKHTLRVWLNNVSD